MRIDRILAVDPGDRSGLAYYDYQSKDRFGSWEVGDIDSMLKEVYDQIATDWVQTVVVEDFIINADTCKKKKPQRWPLEAVGAIRWMCYQHSTKFVLQTPSQKDWMDDNKLKRLGWYKGSSKKTDTKGHADDAARHLGVYLGVTRQEQDFLRRII